MAEVLNTRGRRRATRESGSGEETVRIEAAEPNAQNSMVVDSRSNLQ